MDELWNFALICDQTWMQKFPDAVITSKSVLKFTENAAPIPFRTPLQRDEVYDHLTCQKIEYAGNEPEIVQLLIILIENGLGGFLEQDTFYNFSRTCKIFYRALKIKRPVAFPPLEDIPRMKKMSFDVYYIPIENQIHRITLLRKHNYGPNMFACFVDGELVAVRKAGGTIYFLDQNKWKSNYDKLLYTFMVNNTNVSIRPDGESTIFKTISLNFGSYMPKNFAISVHGRCVSESEKKRKSRSRWDCFAIFFTIFLFPLLLLYFAVFIGCGVCIMGCTTRNKCKVRKYMVAENFTRHKAKDVIGDTVVTPPKIKQKEKESSNVVAVDVPTSVIVTDSPEDIVVD